MIWFYIGFTILIFALLALDLGIFHKEPHEAKIKEALGWSAIWIMLGLAFSGFIYQAYEGHWLGIGMGGDLMSVSLANVNGRINGASAVLKYFTGYLIEKSLSVDNIFVIAMIFGLLDIPAAYRRRVLFFGILGAIITRGAMIALGIKLITNFSWIVYVFGGVLLIIALKMLFIGQDEGLSGSAFLCAVRRRLFVTERFHGQRFWVRAGNTTEPDAIVDTARPGAILMTPLFFALLVVEFADLVFSVESIPAVLAVTTDPFLVFTSNVFAILGMRSLYFVLESMIGVFHYLKTALAFVLILVGIKMMAHSWLEALIGNNLDLWMLALIGAVLAGGVIASILSRKRNKASPRIITYRVARRAFVIVTGFFILATGIAMIALPGPAILVIPLGLGILSGEYAWARRMLIKLRSLQKLDHLSWNNIMDVLKGRVRPYGSAWQDDGRTSSSTQRKEDPPE